MRPNNVSLLVGLFAVIACLASGCGGTTPPVLTSTVASVPATNASVSATITPVPATATSVQPTNTPPPTAPPSGVTPSALGVFGSALEKAKSATAYRVDMQVTGSGDFGLTGTETPAPDTTPLAPTNQELTMISMKGEVNGQDAHLTMQGIFAAFLGIDPSKALEVITAGGNNYIHGPVPLLGATEDKWYELPAGESSVAKPPLTPGSFLDSFTASGLGPNDFRQTGTESLDSHSCDVYSADQAAIEKTFKTLAPTTGSSELSLDSADFRIWLCDDGYLHQVRMAVQGHLQNQPDQKSSFLMQMHIYDYDANIQIEAPSGAEILKAPSFLNIETPTP